MNFFDKIIRTLGKPFPVENRLEYYRNLIILSVFITLFLYIFQPFGISTLESRKFLICLGFGSMTFVGAIIYELSIGQLLKLTGMRANWTFGKWILNTLGAMVFISIANFIFARLLLFGYIQWDLFPSMIYATFMIGIIPITVLGGLSLFKQERKYQIIANEINQLKTPSSSTKDQGSISIFDIPTYQIKYIEALQNYVKIAYINSEGNLKIQTERLTLKGILIKTEGSSIIKCHRSYLVNKDAIVTASGNAQGLLLSLSDCDKIIPVSRTCVPVFRNH